eukprot:GFUD01012041.1.p1 GENE.GFUD01012041.1~~GFUD01012041.1.p1  ORF type:complete len:488 (-),score=123.66 GFUD01012041.1:156-1619(-)
MQFSAWVVFSIFSFSFSFSTMSTKHSVLGSDELFPSEEASEEIIAVPVVNMSTMVEMQTMIEGFETKVTQLESEIFYLKTKGARSCNELKQIPGFEKSGLFFIDPAKTGTPIQVFCDMDLEETWISHDGEDLAPVTFCTGDGCFVKEYSYEAPYEQIEALKAQSETCYQEISYGCKMAPLKNTRFGHYFGWWTGKDGSKKFYIDGDDEDRAVCGCHATSSCLQSMFNSTCNCDAVFLPLWSSDEGKLSNKESLPVRTFVYGGFISSQQEANITVGKLRCSGSSKSEEDKSISASCSGLKQDGATRDGFYLTREESEKSIEASYCQMSKPGYVESNLKVESHDLGGGGSKVVLNVAIQSHSYSSPRKTITTCQGNRNYYNLKTSTLRKLYEQIDMHEAFNKEDGFYTIPETGLYTIMIGKMDGHCDTYYLVEVDEPVDAGVSTTQFYKSYYTNTYTQWFISGTKLQIKTTHTSTNSNSNFQMTIVRIN